MEIVVVTPSEAFHRSAGVRIRYRRLLAAAKQRHKVTLCPIERLTDAADAYVFTKTYQATAPAIAYALASAGKRVILDLYDDYFSMPGTRTARYRSWLVDMARAVHRITVSTPALADRLSHLVERPVVVPDPSPPVDPQTLATHVARKLHRLDPCALRLLWFGVASNPYFETGLADLAAAAPHLADRAGCHRLTVLTNADGADEAALCALSRAPLEVRFAAWSFEAECQAIGAADVAVLPVGAGRFNTGKSVNRAATALAGGAQVLSLGTPLYAALAPFVYRDLATLKADARRGELRLRPSRVAWLHHTLERTGSAERAGGRLIDLIEAIEPEPRPPHAVVLGTVEARDLAEKCGAPLIDALGPGDSGAPLSGHGVVDLCRIAERLRRARTTAEERWPNHEIFLLHEPTLAP